jgi:hypothetical protein
MLAALVLAAACAKPHDAAKSPPSMSPQAAADQPHSTAAASLAPPGPYWVAGRLCGEDDCDNIPGRWRAFAPVDLYAQPDGAAAIIARVALGEWISAIEKKTRYTPARGEVRVAGAGLSVGDVVYGPFPSDEDGHEQVWRAGQRVSIETDAETPQIDWAEPAAPARVMWVRVARASGPGGWLRDPQDFACMGEHPAGDEGC